MTGDWQAWAAPAVVIVTAVIMSYRLFARKKTGCAGACGCSASENKRRLFGAKKRE